MAQYSPAIARLIAALAKLPGVGNKTARRHCFYLLGCPEEEALELADALRTAREQILFCESCCNLTDHSPCDLCSDEGRDKRMICVVESPSDVAAMERTDEYDGLYHVLHGALSPMENVKVEDIKLRELLVRLQMHPEVEEIILANNATTEGEATAALITNLLRPSGLKISRIAQGIPMGSNLEYTDEITLGRAIAQRTQIAAAKSAGDGERP